MRQLLLRVAARAARSRSSTSTASKGRHSCGCSRSRSAGFAINLVLPLAYRLPFFVAALARRRSSCLRPARRRLADCAAGSRSSALCHLPLSFARRASRSLVAAALLLAVSRAGADRRRRGRQRSGRSSARCSCSGCVIYLMASRSRKPRAQPVGRAGVLLHAAEPGVPAVSGRRLPDLPADATTIATDLAIYEQGHALDRARRWCTCCSTASSITTC